MLTTKQIRWAASHDWFVRDNGDGTIDVRDEGDGTVQVIIGRWEASFADLRAWAGY